MRICLKHKEKLFFFYIVDQEGEGCQRDVAEEEERADPERAAGWQGVAPAGRRSDADTTLRHTLALLSPSAHLETIFPCERFWASLIID